MIRQPRLLGANAAWATATIGLPSGARRSPVYVSRTERMLWKVPPGIA